MKITNLHLSVIIGAIVEDENITTVDGLLEHLDENSDKVFEIIEHGGERS